MDYYLWSKPQNKPFFQSTSKQKLFRAIVGSLGHLSSEWRTKHKTDQLTSLFQEAALVRNPYSFSVILTSFLHCRESQALKSIKKVSEGFS
jgi:hypothetical protein